jgi:hypothetical protein
MDALLAILFIVLGSFLFLALVLIGIGTILIFTGPPDLHDFDIDSEQEIKHRRRNS